MQKYQLFKLVIFCIILHKGYPCYTNYFYSFQDRTILFCRSIVHTSGMCILYRFGFFGNLCKKYQQLNLVIFFCKILHIKSPHFSSCYTFVIIVVSNIFQMIESLSSVLKTIIFHGYTEPQEIQSLFPSKFNIYDLYGYLFQSTVLYFFASHGGQFSSPNIITIVTVDKKVITTICTCITTKNV